MYVLAGIIFIVLLFILIYKTPLGLKLGMVAPTPIQAPKPVGP